MLIILHKMAEEKEMRNQSRCKKHECENSRCSSDNGAFTVSSLGVHLCAGVRVTFPTGSECFCFFSAHKNLAVVETHFLCRTFLI